MKAGHLAMVVAAALVLMGCDEPRRGPSTASTPVASSVGTTTSDTGSDLDPCPEGPAHFGDVDGDGRRDTVTLRPHEGVITVRLGSGRVQEVTVHSLCPSLLGLTDVNTDGRDELWRKDGVGNTAHVFNLVTWVSNRPLVVIEPDADNPLFIGWGFSGGATLWCGDTDGDGRTDIIRQEFSRGAQGQIEDERELVYHLRGGTLVGVSQGPARTPPPEDSVQSLICGPVTWP